MPAAEKKDFPDLAAILAPILARVPRANQPLLIAAAERRAAERYRGWADSSENAAQRAVLLACADREDEIARRVEALYPNATEIQSAILAGAPELESINRTIFASRPIREQLAIQAGGERLGAATWRAFARDAEASGARDTYLACAELEERSAEVLESILKDE